MKNDVAVIVVAGDHRQVEDFIADIKNKHGDAKPYHFRGDVKKVIETLETLEATANEVIGDASQPNFEYRGAA